MRKNDFKNVIMASMLCVSLCLPHSILASENVDAPETDVESVETQQDAGNGEVPNDVETWVESTITTTAYVPEVITPEASDESDTKEESADSETEAQEPKEDEEAALEPLTEEDLEGEEIVSIQLPIVYESGESPFNFIMDPQGLIEATDGALYDGASFERGASIYFENDGGDYDYSSRSDYLCVKSHSNIPVRITLGAAIIMPEGLRLNDDSDFVGDADKSVYLAIIDEEGNETPILESGTALTVELPACEEGEGEEYHFALTGKCNPYTEDWVGLRGKPYVAVNWSVEPISLDTEEN